MTSFFAKIRTFAVASLVAAGAALSGGGAAEAQPRGPGLESMIGWVVLGGAQVADRLETDRIRISGRDRYSQVRLCVIGAPMRVRDFEVVFGNGRVQTIDVRRRFDANTCTRAIDLRGRNDRRIDEVFLRYESLRDRGRQPIVILVGR